MMTKDVLSGQYKNILLPFFLLVTYGHAQNSLPCRTINDRDGTCVRQDQMLSVCSQQEIDDIQDFKFPSRCNADLSLFCCETKTQESCQTRTGAAGVCVPLRQLHSRCPTVAEEIQNFIFPPTCSISSTQEGFCCPTEPPLECGQSRVRSIPRVDLIIPDKDAPPVEPNAYPWLVLLGIRTNGADNPIWRCGGTIVDERHVVTAAHCLYERGSRVEARDIIVRVGEHQIDIEQDSSHEDFTILSINVHPAYDPSLVYHDIAVLRLAEPITFGLTANKCCVVQSFDVIGNRETGVIAGWGANETRGPFSNVLQEASVTLLDRPTCNSFSFFSTEDNRRLPQGITQDILCAKNEGDNQDSCQGDSGGGLYVAVDGKYALLGVISAGIGCGGDTPGLYAYVPSYFDWIVNMLQQP